MLSGIACGVMIVGVLFLPRTAIAATCGGTSAVGSKLLDQTHFGTRVTSPGMWVNDPPTSSNCCVVRSIYVIQDANHFAEFGWVVDPSGVSTGCPSAATPTVFVYSTVGATIRCYNGATIATSDYDSSQRFRLENPNHDSYFSGYYEGIFQGDIYASISQGHSWAASERHNTTDSLFAKFNGLQCLGNAGGWNDWNQHTPLDPDSDYSYCPFTHSRFEVRLSC